MAKETTIKKNIDFGKLPDYLGYQVRQTQASVFRDFLRISRETGVTPGEFSLLTMIGANPGINQISLARVYQLDKSTLSYSINALEKRRLIRRTRSADDRRYYSLWLTDDGHSVLQSTTERVEEQERMMDASLKPGERDLLLDLLRKVARAFD